jgi:hypothetical protein
MDLQDRVEQWQFKVMWHGREQNISDFFTKDLPTKEFTSIRALIVPEGRRKSVKELVGTRKTGRQGVQRIEWFVRRVCSRLKLSCPSRIQRTTNHTTEPITQPKS